MSHVNLKAIFVIKFRVLGNDETLGKLAEIWEDSTYQMESSLREVVSK